MSKTIGSRLIPYAQVKLGGINPDIADKGTILHLEASRLDAAMICIQVGEGERGVFDLRQLQAALRALDFSPNRS